MSRFWHRFLLFLTLTIAVLIVSGQGKPIYQQYLFNHQLYNPAYTAIYDNVGCYALIQNQWAGSRPASYQQMVSFHIPVFNNFLGTGLDVVNERIDSIRSFTVFTDLSYELMLSESVRLRMGATFGYQDLRNTLLEDAGYRGPNLGIGAFIYNHDYYFSLSFPRLLRNNSATNPEGYFARIENRQFFFSNGFIFKTKGGMIIRPVLMYSVPYSAPAQIDMSLNFLIKRGIWSGIMYRTDRSVGWMVQGLPAGKFRIGLGGDVRRNNLSGKLTGDFDISVNYETDFYHRDKKPSFYF